MHFYSSTSFKYISCGIILVSHVVVHCFVLVENVHTSSKQRGTFYFKAMKKPDAPNFLFQEAWTLQWINGRRCIFVPSRGNKLHNQVDAKTLKKSESNGHELQQAKKSANLPPIIILGGMAQCIESWQHHFNDFSKERDVFMYEYLGSGLGSSPQSSSPIDESNIDDFAHVLTNDYYQDVSLNYQSQEFEAIIRQALTSCNSSSHDKNISSVHPQVDVIAFSLGARITLATMAKHPTLIRKAHLTGIAAQRDVMGDMIFESWKEMLSPNQDSSSNLRPFAWSLIMSTYSKTCLEQAGFDKVLGWVNHICSNHHRMGLYQLLEQNRHVDPIEHTQEVARNSCTDIQIAVGSQDVISTPDQANRLNEALGTRNTIQIYQGCGHAVMNENPRQWRKDVLTFLNK